MVVRRKREKEAQGDGHDQVCLVTQIGLLCQAPMGIASCSGLAAVTPISQDNAMVLPVR